MSGKYKFRPREIEAFQLTKESVADKDGWPDWLKEIASEEARKLYVTSKGQYLFFEVDRDEYCREVKNPKFSGFGFLDYSREFLIFFDEWIISFEDRLAVVEEVEFHQNFEKV